MRKRSGAVIIGTIVITVIVCYCLFPVVREFIDAIAALATFLSILIAILLWWYPSKNEEKETEKVTTEKEASEKVTIEERVKKIERQSIVLINGVAKDSKSRDFKVEVNANDLVLLSQSVHPLPIDPTGRVSSSIDLRLDSRPLDLRNPETSAIFKIRHEIFNLIRKELIENQFVEVHSPKIIEQGVEGGSTLFQIDYFGKKAYLAQSPQLYKEQLIISLDRVYEISAYFRAEKSHTRRHLNEFISIDIEAAFMDNEGVMAIAENIVGNVIKGVSNKCKKELTILNHENLKTPKLPFKRITYSEVINELRNSGSDIKFGDDLDTLALKNLSRTQKGFYFIVEWPTKLKPFYIESKE